MFHILYKLLATNEENTIPAENRFSRQPVPTVMDLIYDLYNDGSN